MYRREFLKGSSVSALSLLSGCAPTSASKPASQVRASRHTGKPAASPDIVIFLTDDQNARCAGYAGDTNARTPNIDALANGGISFDAMYTPAPVCMPSRCCLATGLYPHSLGLFSNANTYSLNPEVGTIFHNMRQLGYFTAQIGKLHYRTHDGQLGHYESTDDYYSSLGLDYVEHISSPYRTCFEHTAYQDLLRKKGVLDDYCRDMAERFEQGQYHVSPSVVGAPDYNDTFITKKAIEFMRRRPVDTPVFLVVGLTGPHTPMDAPEEYAQMFDRHAIELPPNVPEKFYWSLWNKNNQMVTRDDIRCIRANYYAKIALLDDCVGALISVLKERGKWDNTLFVFTSDHGEMMGAQGKMSKGKFWEESARVPCVMHWPKTIAPRQRTEALCELMDLFPTIVEAAGGEVLPQRAARSLWPIAMQQKEQIRDAVFGEIGKSAPLNFMVRQGRYKWFRFADSHYQVEASEYLYDLAEDPYEMRNLIDSADHQNILASLKLRHLEYFKQNQWNWQPAVYLFIKGMAQALQLTIKQIKRVCLKVCMRSSRRYRACNLYLFKVGVDMALAKEFPPGHRGPGAFQLALRCNKRLSYR